MCTQVDRYTRTPIRKHHLSTSVRIPPEHMMTGNHSTTTTFILAGGLGTRLRSLSGEQPKGMMPIDGEPFLRRMLERLAAQDVREVVLCLGYGADAIIEYFEAHPLPSVQLHYSIEDEPRGTAGALRAAEPFWSEHNLILNGDTELEFALHDFYHYHRTMCADLSIGLAHVDDAARYGRVRLRDDGRVETFLEKDGIHHSGLVNAGVYLATRHTLDAIPRAGAYSVEREWLPDLLQRDCALYALPIAESFVDIGTPEDYLKLANRQVK